jgi:putative hydrolase of the HAD superfamily
LPPAVPAGTVRPMSPPSPAAPPEPKGFDDVDVWVFDLDNTLYPSRSNLFDQIDRRMAEYVSRLLAVDLAVARTIQKSFFHKHGSTLRGLLTEHAIDPHGYLDYVHDIDLAVIDPAPELDRALARLPGRKLIFTNGSVPHAERVTERLGIGHHFEAVFDIVLSDFVPKPQPQPYDTFLKRYGVRADRAAMFEDIARNLKPAFERGMTTVWIPGGGERASVGAGDGHIHHVAEDIAVFLGGVLPAERRD